MNSSEKERLINQSLRYIGADALPTPLPANRDEYEGWRARAGDSTELAEELEEAWADLYRLVDEEPVVAWEVLCAIAARCQTDLDCSTLAAGPLENFVQKHGKEFARQIEDELEHSEGFRRALRWL